MFAGFIMEWFCVCKSNVDCMQVIKDEGERSKKKLQHMSKLGVPYLPCSLVWTKISFDKHSSVYPTYLPKKFGHFGTTVCSWILNFATFFLSSSYYAWWTTVRVRVFLFRDICPNFCSFLWISLLSGKSDNVLRSPHNQKQKKRPPPYWVIYTLLISEFFEDPFQTPSRHISNIIQ